MFALLKIAGMILKEFGYLITDEFFWIILIILITLYKRNTSMEQTMLGKPFSLAGKVANSVLVGCAAGLMGSLLVVLLGICIENYTAGASGTVSEGIGYIWVMAIFLALFNPRYLCFSYAGGAVALLNLTFGFPQINVPGLMALIGILHLLESFLIWFDGYTNAVPLFLKRKNGEVTGGFFMNKIWPIPLVILGITAGGAEGSAYSLAGVSGMPAWWPPIKPAAEGIGSLLFQPLMIPVILGYGDMAVTTTAEKRCGSSAFRLAGYSIVLIILAVLANFSSFFAFSAAIFAPLAHEALILYGSKEEESGKPLFGKNAAGITVLYAKPDSPAGAMKLEPGDIILSVNNRTLQNDKQLSEFLAEYPSFIWMEILKTGGERKTVEYRDYKSGIGSLGALLVPEVSDIYFEMGSGTSVFGKLLNRFTKNNNKDTSI